MPDFDALGDNHLHLNRAAEREMRGIDTASTTPPVMRDIEYADGNPVMTRHVEAMAMRSLSATRQAIRDAGVDAAPPVKPETIEYSALDNLGYEISMNGLRQYFADYDRCALRTLDLDVAMFDDRMVAVSFPDRPDIEPERIAQVIKVVDDLLKIYPMTQIDAIEFGPTGVASNGELALGEVWIDDHTMRIDTRLITPRFVEREAEYKLGEESGYHPATYTDTTTAVVAHEFGHLFFGGMAETDRSGLAHFLDKVLRPSVEEFPSFVTADRDQGAFDGPWAKFTFQFNYTLSHCSDWQYLGDNLGDVVYAQLSGYAADDLYKSLQLGEIMAEGFAAAEYGIDLSPLAQRFDDALHTYRSLS